MNNDLGNRIYTLRNKMNLTQDQLAEKVGVSRQAISKWERNEGLPDLYNMKELSKALGVSIDELMEGDFKNPEPSTSNTGGNYLKKLLKKHSLQRIMRKQRKSKRCYLLLEASVSLLESSWC